MRKNHKTSKNFQIETKSQQTIIMYATNVFIDFFCHVFQSNNILVFYIPVMEMFYTNKKNR